MRFYLILLALLTSLQFVFTQGPVTVPVSGNTFQADAFLGNESVTINNNYFDPTTQLEALRDEYDRLVQIKQEAEGAVARAESLSAEAERRELDAKKQELTAKLAEEKLRKTERQQAETLKKIKQENQNLVSNKQRFIEETQAAIDSMEQRLTDSESKKLKAQTSITSTDPELKQITASIDEKIDEIEASARQIISSVPRLTKDFEVYEVEDEQGNKSLGFSVEEIQQDPNYVFVGELVEGVRVAKKFNKFGALNSRGETIIDYQYDYFEPFRNGVAVVSKFGEWKLIDKENNTIREFVGAKEVRTLESGHRIVSKSNSASLQNFAGEVILNDYEFLSAFNGGDLLIARKGLTGIVTLSGEIVRGFTYEDIEPLRSNGYAHLKGTDGKYGLANSLGEEVVETISDKKVKVADKNLAYIYAAYEKKSRRVSYTDYWIGLYKMKSHVLMKPIYDEISFQYHNSQMLIADVSNSNSGRTKSYKAIIDLQKATEYKCNFIEKMVGTDFGYLLKRFNKWTFVNHDFDLLFKGEFASFEHWKDIGLFKVKEEKGWGVIDINGKYIAKPIYPSIERLPLLGSEFFKVLSNNGKGWGVFSTDGKTIVKPQYDEIEQLSSSGNVVVTKNGKLGMINRAGKLVLPTVYNRITTVNRLPLIEAEKDSLGLELFDLKGNLAFPYRVSYLYSKGDFFTVKKRENNRKEIFRRDKTKFLPGEYSDVRFFDSLFTVVDLQNICTVYDYEGTAKCNFNAGYISYLLKSDIPGHFRLSSSTTHMDINRKTFRPVYYETYEQEYEIGKDLYKLRLDYDEYVVVNLRSGQSIGPYNDIEKISDEYFKAQKGSSFSGSWGVVSIRGERISDFAYRAIEEFNGDLFIATVYVRGSGTKSGTFNLNGAEVIPFCFDKVSFTDLNLVEVTKGEEVFLVNPDGTCASNCEKYRQVLKVYYAKKD